MRDEFFTKKNCDRCYAELSGRTMSWFNHETICLKCADKEREIRNQLPENGRAYEGCGYIPKV